MEIGSTAPDFRLPSAQGPDVSLSDFRGQRIVIAWFTKGIACPCCRRQMVQLGDAPTTHGPGGGRCRGSPDDWRSRPRFDARRPRRLPQGGEAMATSRVPDELDVVRGILYATLLSLTLWSLVLALLALLTADRTSF